VSTKKNVSAGRISVQTLEGQAMAGKMKVVENESAHVRLRN
jgi:hypothetical protein